MLDLIEPPGVHSGDSTQVYPPQRLPDVDAAALLESARALPQELGAISLVNLQLARADRCLYLLEVNP
jgi:carbamoyl-phosphate synthase large subunit